MHDFRTMSEKAVFDAKLRNEVVDFGFIPFWNMKRFLNFCIKHGFLYQPPTYRAGAYLVKHKFAYGFTGSNFVHLPLGRVIEWIADIFYKGEYVAPLNGYVQRHHIVVEPRGTREGFTYVTWYGGLIR